MSRRVTSWLPLAAAALPAFLACGTDPNPPADLDCASPPELNLAVGSSTILDATVNRGCVTIPAAGPGGATHLVVAYSGAGAIAPNGVRANYSLLGELVAASPAPALRGPSLLQARETGPDFDHRFHLMLREREAELGRNPALRLPPVDRPNPVPPALGSKRTFKVCADTSCSGFVNVTATALFVGPRGAIYLDDTVPPNGLTQADIDSLGSLFDGAAPNIYSADTTAFGRESDLDQNSVVIILLTDAVNALSGTCPGGTIILGYFFGLDLVQDPNSNNGEVFYGLVPNPNASSCRVTRNQVFAQLPPVLAHEFQHMISFNQKALVRGAAPEVTWLNEGLSHFAEEIAGRSLASGRCPLFSSCLEQFTALGDLPNAYSYLLDPESEFLVYPATSFGDLAERGASWLFVRWLADHFAADTLLGTQLTRALVQTGASGAANVAQATGTPFDQLVGQWQMANYTEALTSFQSGGRLRYRTWNLPAAFASAVGGTYPLAPDGVLNGSYSRNGVLRGGSGRHVLVIQQPNTGAVTFQLKGDNSFANVTPRLAVVRIQ